MSQREVAQSTSVACPSTSMSQGKALVQLFELQYEPSFFFMEYFLFERTIGRQTDYFSPGYLTDIFPPKNDVSFQAKSRIFENLNPRVFLTTSQYFEISLMKWVVIF